MSIDITSDHSVDEWNSYVEQSPHATPLHRHEALELLARESDTALHTLVGFKGNEPVGALPLFEGTCGPFRLVRSPPSLEMYTLGPALLNFEKLKQRKAERRQWRFTEGCLDWIDDSLDPDYVDIRTVGGYTDMRPFTWNGYDVTPSYTYTLDIDDDPETLLDRFSRDARTNIRDARDDGGLEPRTAGSDTIGTIIGQIRERHADQGEQYSLRPTFVEDLSAALPDGAIQVYTLEADGEVVTGMITYETEDTVYRWQGGVKVDAYPSANDFLDWHIIREARDGGRSRYDLVGANLRRLCRYKSKFNPDPSVYYVAKRRTPTMRAATEVYSRLPNRLQVL